MPLSRRSVASLLPRISCPVQLPRSFRVPVVVARQQRHTQLVAKRQSSRSYRTITPCLQKQRSSGGDERLTQHRDNEDRDARGSRPPEATAAATADPDAAGNSDPFGDLDVYGDIPAPGSAVDMVYDTGFQFANGVRFHDGAGALLVDNEVFKWRPAERGSPVEEKAIGQGILELGREAWGMLDVVHPKPELLIVGTGRRTLLLSKDDRARLTEMGIRMDVMDTTHAAAQYNLLATERSPREVAAALLPEGFGDTTTTK